MFVLMLSGFFSFILIGVPVKKYFTLAKMNDNSSSKVDSIVGDNSHMREQSAQTTIFRIDNVIFLIISIILTILFSYLNTQDQSDDKNQSSIWFFSTSEISYHCFILGIIEPIKPFYITDRRKTVAIIVIQMLEIFEIVDKTLIDLSEASQSGIWMKIFIRMRFVLING
jgi:hypothetical protein